MLLCMVVFVGCKKSDTDSAPPPPPPVEGSESVSAPAESAVADTAAAVSSAAVEVSDSKPIADVKAEAEKLDVAKLREIALAYKDAMMAKDGELKKLAEQLKAIPLAEKMGAEAKGLQSDMAAATASVSALLERFNIYYNKLQAMGGDVSGLEPGA
jgi:hypothetical protein